MASMEAESEALSPIQITDLPNEVIEVILGQEFLTIQDMYNFCMVNKRFSDILSENNELWRRKFISTWPNMFNRLFGDKRSRHFTQTQNTNFSWKEESKLRHECGQFIREELDSFSREFYGEDEVSNDSMIRFNRYVEGRLNEHPHALEYLIDEVDLILNDGREHENLTLKYYAEKVIRYLKHQSLTLQWKSLLQEIDRDETNSVGLIHGTILLSQWFQTKCWIDEVFVRRQLHLIAELVIEELKAFHPSNPVITSGLLSDQDTDALTDSRWNPIDTKHILICINKVLFNQLRFTGNDEDYYHANNSFIDKVLETRKGIPITLCLLYKFVAAKLGVLTLPVNYPGHFLLKWRQHPDLQDKNDSQIWTYIDAFRGGKFMDYAELRNMPGSMSHYRDTVCTQRHIYRRMCWNLVEVGRQSEMSNEGLLYLKNGLELLILVAPLDVEARLLLSRVYIHLCVDLDKVEEMLEEVISQDETTVGVVNFLRQSVQSQRASKKHGNSKWSSRNPLAPKFRPQKSNVQFAIGMIMRHKKYRYNCVIYGWDHECKASRDWIYQMGVHQLKHADKQPFYNVLVDDGSNRYAAQENLEICQDPQPITHPEIGRYFQKFAGSHYEPNEERATQYPEDHDIRCGWLTRGMTEDQAPSESPSTSSS